MGKQQTTSETPAKKATDKTEDVSYAHFKKAIKQNAKAIDVLTNLGSSSAAIKETIAQLTKERETIIGAAMSFVKNELENLV